MKLEFYYAAFSSSAFSSFASCPPYPGKNYPIFISISEKQNNFELCDKNAVIPSGHSQHSATNIHAALVFFVAAVPSIGNDSFFCIRHTWKRGEEQTLAAQN